MTGSDSQIQSDHLPGASLLAATGGILDAMVYVLHGHVFANAMSGNVILLGITLFSRDWMQALRHIVPILSFVAGTVASRLLRLLPQVHAAVIVLALEMAVLGIAGWLPLSFPEMIFTAIIAFISAFQVSTFRHIDDLPYNSTFITGNLRTATEAFVNQLLAPNSEEHKLQAGKARKLFLVCLWFLFGALAGAWGSPCLGNRTLWLAAPLLLVVLCHLLYLNMRVDSSTSI
jgi:uncharacterized membrane protein YoaK (UPF0700 family)